MTARAFTSFQSEGWFGYAGYPDSARPWQNKQLWDWSHCCSMDVQQNRFFGLIAALFGYTVRPAHAICPACACQPWTLHPLHYNPSHVLHCTDDNLSIH